MRGILARGMTSQQVPGALGKCDFIPSNAQIAPQAGKGKAVQELSFLSDSFAAAAKD